MSDLFTLDPATLLDNVDARQVEFSAEVDGEMRDFAVLYDVLEALDGPSPEQGPVAAFRRHQATVERAAASALARDGDQDRVIVSENDLD
jgi:hypothetical protein